MPGRSVPRDLHVASLPLAAPGVLGSPPPAPHPCGSPRQPQPSPPLQDLFSALIKGPTRTPYEDGLYLFDIQLPNIYPAVPPHFCYLSQCSGRLNPNLYDNGKVCVSLLGTWIGKVSAMPCPVKVGEGPPGRCLGHS